MYMSIFVSVSVHLLYTFSTQDRVQRCLWSSCCPRKKDSPKVSLCMANRKSLQKQKRLWNQETKYAEFSCCHQLWITAFPERRHSPASLHSAPADQKKAREILSMYEATLPFSLPFFFIKYGTFPVCWNSLVDLGYYSLVLQSSS